MNPLQLHIEALIFAAQQAINIAEIKACLDKTLDTNVDEERIVSLIEDLQKKYQTNNFAYELVAISDGYQFLSKQDYHATIATYLNQKSKRKLSNAALETLSIIAYKQPITKAEIEQIRGVNCDYSVQKLLEKELITISGRSPKPGRPLLYSTSPFFMNYFGLRSMKDLPKLKEIEPNKDNEIGVAEP